MSFKFPANEPNPELAVSRLLDVRPTGAIYSFMVGRIKYLGYDAPDISRHMYSVYGANTPFTDAGSGFYALHQVPKHDYGEDYWLKYIGFGYVRASTQGISVDLDAQTIIGGSSVSGAGNIYLDVDVFMRSQTDHHVRAKLWVAGSLFEAEYSDETANALSLDFSGGKNIELYGIDPGGVDNITMFGVTAFLKPHFK